MFYDGVKCDWCKEPAQFECDGYGKATPHACPSHKDKLPRRPEVSVFLISDCGENVCSGYYRGYMNVEGHSPKCRGKFRILGNVITFRDHFHRPGCTVCKEPRMESSQGWTKRRACKCELDQREREYERHMQRLQKEREKLQKEREKRAYMESLISAAWAD